MRPIKKMEAVQSPEKSKGIILDWLERYGCVNFSVGRQNGESYVFFEFPHGTDGSIPVKLAVRTAAYADKMMRRDPYVNPDTGRSKRKSREQWQREHKENAERAAWSLAADWLTTELTMVELGIATLEEVFLSRLLSPQGVTVAEVFDMGKALAGENPLRRLTAGDEKAG